MSSRLTGPVEVVGAGLLGTSVALACRRAGLDVLLSDVAPEHVRTASGLGAGRPRTPRGPAAAGRGRRTPGPPGRGDRRRPGGVDAVVTDVGSVKSGPRGGGRGGDVSRGAGAVRRRAPDGGQRALRPARRERRPVRRPAVGGDPARDVRRRRGRRWSRSWSRPAARVAVRLQPGGARPGRGPDLAPAPPAGGADGRPARRRAAGPPRAVRAGRPRRHPGRRQRPGDVGADRHRERRRGRRAAGRGARPSWTP